MWAVLRRPIRLALAAAWLFAGCTSLPDETRLTASEPAELYPSPNQRVDRAQDTSSETGLAKLSPSNVSKAIKRMSGLGPDEQKARERYRLGESDFESAVAARRQGDEGKSQKLFVSAADRYWDAAKLWPDSSLEEDAYFWSAEAYFFADRYPKATKAYDALVKKHPNTRHMDKVAARQFALADYWLELNKESSTWMIVPNLGDKRRPLFDTFGNALKVFDGIRFDDPTGKLSDDATMAAANACFQSGKYARADTLYTDLRDSFPDSDHQFNAHLLGLKCKVLTYEGPDYDGIALDEAEDLVQRMFRLFPNEAAKHREVLTNALADIRLKKAERQWRRAEYYDRRKEYGSASYYYEIVRREYHDTNLAQKANDRIAQIGDLPAEPPQRLSWLTNLFPEPEQTKPLIARDHVDTQRR